MKEIINKIEENSPEGNLLDYKWKFYDLNNDIEKGELIKDIISFSNLHLDSDKFIVFGIKEKNGLPIEFQNMTIEFDESKLQQILKTYAEPKIHFEFSAIEYKDFRLTFIRIYGNKNKPYLFKKDIGKFKEGDGFIRYGTSTRKLLRSDFDEIYKLRERPNDRKKDLKVIPSIFFSDNPNIKSLNFPCIDINVENISNQSLEIEVEMKVYKSKEIIFYTEDEIKKQLDQINKPKSFFQSISFEPSRFDISFKETEDDILISRNFQSKITIQQKDLFNSIFGKYLFFFIKENVDEAKIQLEVIIRSDSFLEGPYYEKFYISVPRLG